MSIKRYEVNGPSSVFEDENGSLVDYQDYSALEAKCAALAAENAGMDAFVDSLLAIAWEGCSADGAEIQELAMKYGLLRQEVYSADEHENQVDDPGNFEDGDPVYFRVETPATASFLAEARAQGVDAAIDTAKNVVAQEFQYKDFETAQRVCSYFPESDLVGKVEMVEWLEEFAAQLRQDANTAELVAAGIITRIED